MNLISESVIAGAKKDNHDCWTKIIDTYYDNLTNFISLRVSNKTAVEDIVSSTWLCAYKYINSYSNKFSFKTWLFKIAINETNKYFNKEESNQKIIQNFSLTVEIDDIQYDEDISLEFFHKLSKQHQEILQLKYIHSFSHKEIADFIGTNENAARSLLYRAKQQLVSAIEGRNKVEKLQKN